MREAGFEPARVAPLELESSALDHSATHASYLIKMNLMC